MPAIRSFACLFVLAAAGVALAAEPPAPATPRNRQATATSASTSAPPTAAAAGLRQTRVAGVDYTFVFDARPGAAGRRPAPDLLRAIGAWLAVSFDLKKSDALPDVRLESPAKITNFRFTGLLSDDPRLTARIPPGQREVVAAYDELSQTILLPLGWSGGSPTELSILVHEMVHHLQHQAKMRFACPAASESLAYSAQDKWLQLFGRSLAGDFEVDAFTIAAASLCLP